MDRNRRNNNTLAEDRRIVSFIQVPDDPTSEPKGPVKALATINFDRSVLPPGSTREKIACDELPLYGVVGSFVLG